MGDPQIPVSTDSLPPKKGCTPLPGADKPDFWAEKREAAGPSRPSTETLISPSFSVLTQLHPPRARCLPSRSPAGHAPQRTARELQRSPAEGGSCLARRDGKGPTRHHLPPPTLPLATQTRVPPSRKPPWGSERQSPRRGHLRSAREERVSDSCEAFAARVLQNG